MANKEVKTDRQRNDNNSERHMQRKNPHRREKVNGISIWRVVYIENEAGDLDES